MALGAQVYDPRDEASMIWRNLQLIACIGDYGLEEIEVVNFDCEIRKQAQFPPRRQRQRVSISPSWPQRDQPTHDSANAFAIQRNAISNDMIVAICVSDVSLTPCQLSFVPEISARIHAIAPWT